MSASSLAAPKPALGSAILKATLVAGALDILFVGVMSEIRGKGPVFMLQGIAGGLVGDAARKGGLPMAAVGLVTHFAIMAVMVSVFALAATRLAILRRRPILSGAAYGLALYVAMTYVVLPLRWPGLAPRFNPIALMNQTFAHTVLVGIPIALIVAHALKTRD